MRFRRGLTQASLLSAGVLMLSGCKGEVQGALPSGAPSEMQLEARSCDQGESTACNNVGAMYEAGEGVPVDLEQAAALYRRACDAGATLACVNLAELATADAASGDPVEILRGACETRELTACLRLGELYADPSAAQHDDTLARQYLQTACESNIMAGCVGWADLLAAGRGGELDLEQAHHLYERTCNNAFPDGCARWGEVLVSGPVAGRDAQMGAAQLERACANDALQACQRLSLLQRSGAFGVQADYVASEYHRRRACELGAEEWCAEATGLVALRHAQAWKNVNAPPEMDEAALEQLTLLGGAQKAAWAAWRPPQALSMVFASPSSRAQFTARPIADGLGLHLTPSDDFGPVASGTDNDVPVLWTDRVNALREGRDEAGEGGVSLGEAGQVALQRALAEAADGFALVVTHGDLIVGMMIATGMEPAEALIRMPGHAEAVLFERVGDQWTTVAGPGPFEAWPELPSPSDYPSEHGQPGE